jgi:uncharacterized protein
MRFVCDATLGKLARYLRMLGFDAACMDRPPQGDRMDSREDPPYFLTRGTRAWQGDRIIRIRADKVRDQLIELGNMLPLSPRGDLIMSRCILCNTVLEETDRQEIEQSVPEYVFHRHTRFTRCPCCKRVYWSGTHAKGMNRFVRENFGVE